MHLEKLEMCFEDDTSFKKRAIDLKLGKFEFKLKYFYTLSLKNALYEKPITKD